jgi:catechol 2,3-dioxygenase-like lactoylglutathione lyase family enzyme
MVNDVDQSIEFYTKHLGFELVEKMGPAFATVKRDGQIVWLSGPQSSAARPMPDGRQPEAGGWNRFVIEVDNIDELVRAMKQDGVTFRNDIISGPGGKQTVADDPSGNPIEIFQPAGS